MRLISTAIASAVYLIGFIVVHIHLLRFGIFEISAINLFYLLVGCLTLAALIPSFTVIMILEFYIYLVPSEHKGSLKKKIVEGAFIVIFIITLAMIIILSVKKHENWRYIFNFNLYLYPKYYVVWNITVYNVELFLIWCFLLIIKRKNVLMEHLKYLAYGFLFIFFVNYSVYFGRTIYPVIHSGIGGGSPIASKITLNEEITYSSFILHRNAIGIYFYEANSLSLNIAELDPLEQYALDINSNFHKLAIENNVVFIPNAEIKKIVLFGESQKSIFNRHHSTDNQ